MRSMTLQGKHFGLLFQIIVNGPAGRGYDRGKLREMNQILDKIENVASTARDGNRISFKESKIDFKEAEYNKIFPLVDKSGPWPAGDQGKAVNELYEIMQSAPHTPDPDAKKAEDTKTDNK